MKKRRNYITTGQTAIIISAVVIIAVLSVIIITIAQNIDKGNGDITNSTTDTDTDTSAVESDIDSDNTTGTVTNESGDDIDTDVNTNAHTDADTELPPPEHEYPVGIYMKSDGVYKLCDEYVSVWPSDDSDPLWSSDTWTYSYTNLICDVAYFSLFPSAEDKIKSAKWDVMWLPLWEALGLDENYKIGYELNIVLADGDDIKWTVKSPADTFLHEEYFELYLYDCVAHAHDSRYSHITEKTNYDDTKNVMIKITLRNRCYDIDYIVLTGFIYKSEDEFDENGYYKGANRASCVVRREK